MDRKIGFGGFKLNKKTVESKSLFAEDDEPKERKKLVPFDEDDEQPKQIPFEEDDEPKEKLIVFDKEHPKKLVDFEEDEVSDELREKMGFSGFGKIKPRKEPKVSQKTADEPESKSKPKARQFDLEKQIGISKEIAEERRSKLEQLDDLPAEDAPKAVSTESDVQKEESDQDDTPADPADQGAENEEDDLDEGEDNR